MVHHQAAVQHLQEEELALHEVLRAVGVVRREDAAVLLLDDLAAAQDELPRGHHAALLHLGGQQHARGAEEERVHVAERVPRVESPVVDDGRRDDLRVYTSAYCLLP